MSIGADDVLEGGDLVALHGRLQGVDRVDLGDDHPGALAPQALGAALAHVAVAQHERGLAADHHVGGPVDAVDQRVAAAVEVVELRLGDRVVDVDGREQQLAPLDHLVEAVHAGGGLLGDALDGRRHPRPLRAGPRAASSAAGRARWRTRGWTPSPGRAPRRASRTPRPCGRAAWRRRRRRGSCSARRRRPGHVIICSVHHQYSSSVSPFQANTGMPWGSSGVPFGPTATAAAAWSCVEKMLQLAQRTSAPELDERLDQHRGLDRHVQRAARCGPRPAASAARTPCAAPADRASRARPGGSPGGRTGRARGRRRGSRGAPGGRLRWQSRPTSVRGHPVGRPTLPNPPGSTAVTSPR